jgi:plasmid stabilization system protein ParE
MNFQVIWRNAATRGLTSIVARAMDQGLGTAAITRAVAALDQKLRQNPMGIGESRSEGERIVFERPLWVYYEVHEDEKVVIVLSVGYDPRK